MAADSGHAHANYYLGKLTYLGKGVKQSYTDAAKYYKDAANSKDKYAYYALGKMYFYGKGIPQDYSKSAVCFFHASKKNLPCADYQFSKMYEQGLGVDEDAYAAKVLYKKALTAFLEQERNHPDGFTEYRIGQMYSIDQGTQMDISESIK